MPPQFGTFKRCKSAIEELSKKLNSLLLVIIDNHIRLLKKLPLHFAQMTLKKEMLC